MVIYYRWPIRFQTLLEWPRDDKHALWAMTNILHCRFHSDGGTSWSSHNCQGRLIPGVIVVLASARNHYWAQEAILLPWCSLPWEDLLQLHFKLCDVNVHGGIFHHFGKSSVKCAAMHSHSISHNKIPFLKTRVLWLTIKSPWPELYPWNPSYYARTMGSEKGGLVVYTSSVQV